MTITYTTKRKPNLEFARADIVTDTDVVALASSNAVRTAAAIHGCLRRWPRRIRRRLYPYGLPANRIALETFKRYVETQELASELPPVTEWTA